ncbi:MAG: hypothetical protein U0T81_04730 [Saprospiraceae bacterium]
MKKNNLLRPKIGKTKKAKDRLNSLFWASQPFEHLDLISNISISPSEEECSIAYDNRYYEQNEYCMDATMGIKEDVKALFQYILESYRLPRCVTVRNDNGSQMESDLVRKFLASEGILQEFTRPTTPQQNGHIEAYHSMIDRTICQICENKNIEQGNDIFGRFENYFYNHERIHSGIGCKFQFNV